MKTEHRINSYYVYIMGSKSNKVLYVGYTSDLSRRIKEHKNKLIEGFTSKYNVTKLVYYESVSGLRNAQAREKLIKGWLREKKVKLIKSINPDWEDLAEKNRLLVNKMDLLFKYF